MNHKEPTIQCAHSKMMDVSELIFHINPSNPNTHDKKQIKAIASVIKKTGWRAPITVSKRSGLITKGHGRLEAALYSGWKQCPVDLQEYKNEAEEISDMIADFKLAAMSVFDNEKAFEVINSISVAFPVDFDLEMTGISSLDFDLMKPENDFIPQNSQDEALPFTQDLKPSQSKEQKTREIIRFTCPQCGFKDVVHK